MTKMAYTHMRPTVRFNGTDKQETECHMPRLVPNERSVYNPMLTTCPRCPAARTKRVTP